MLGKEKQLRALNEWAQDVVNNAKSKLMASGKSATGVLYNSINYKIVNRPYGPTILFAYEDYGQYVESGRRIGARFPPPGPILQWIKARGIRGRDKRGRFIKDKSLVFLIQRAISRDGIKPFPFYKDAVGAAIKDLGPELAKIIGIAIKENIKNATVTTT